MKLAVAYSVAGREDDARGVTEDIIGHRLRGSEAQFRHVTDGMAPVRAADQLHNHATRLTRIAYLETLSAYPAADARAAELLSQARAAISLARERRVSEHGMLLEDLALAQADLEDAVRLVGQSDRQARLEVVACRLREIVVRSHQISAVGPGRIRSRHASYGAALTELARCQSPDTAAATARLARVCLAPLIAVREIDAAYTISATVRYGDACAMSGDPPRARAAWLLVRSRVARARPDHPVLRALDRRIEEGVVPVPEDNDPNP